jgi:2C-methyl-D-erythritol 2,4-cyclodiphosphate synthase
MRKTISAAAGVLLSAVNIKAKTNEGAGSIGRKESVAAYAVVTLRENNKI